jgi:type I restriction enzyme R subunit
MGWIYLPHAEALRLRGGRLAGVLLEPVLMDWLRRNNRVQYKGQALPFEEGNIVAAVQALKAVALDGLVRTNEKIYDLLCLGKSFEQVIDGDRKSFTLRYIDFDRPERNIFHLVEEYAVERVGRRETRKPDEEELEARSGDPALDVRAENVRRPDIVLFVNGIPLGVIECKRPDLKDPIKEAISQHLRNQRDEEIPHLFQFAQILLAVAVREAEYGTVDTPAKFWSVWKEQLGKADEDRLAELVNSEPEPITEDPVFDGRSNIVREHFASYGERRLTEQDRTLFALCRPERFLELMYRFVVFDAGRKKLARWQQFFCVRDTLDRVKQRG